ncbi:MAG: response regulator [Candidatus Aenigmarchaeota archaeon]|nr:response regulator [Candidatus Aenigmarchaeota archaeon]
MSNILIIDDEGDIRLLVKSVLENEGHVVDDAPGGKEGIEKIRGKKFDLVILDFFMPGMSGREVLENIRADPKISATKVIFMTVANFSASGLEELKKLGCIDYIQKPIDNDDFVRRVSKALE